MKKVLQEMSKDVRHYAEVNNKHTALYVKHKKVNVYGYVLSKPLLYGRFEYMKDLSVLVKEFIMNYNKETTSVIHFWLIMIILYMYNLTIVIY